MFYVSAQNWTRPEFENIQKLKHGSFEQRLCKNVCKNCLQEPFLTGNLFEKLIYKYGNLIKLSIAWKIVYICFCFLSRKNNLLTAYKLDN